MIVLADIFIGIFVEFGFNSSAQRWNHVPYSVEESDDVKLLWDSSDVTDSSPANKPNIIFVMKQCHCVLLFDFACPADCNIETKEVTKYQDLVLEVQRL